MKKKNKKKVFAITVNPYSQECIIVVNGHIDDAISFLKKQKTENADLVIKHILENKEEYDKGHSKNGGVLFPELPFGYIMMFSHLPSWIETVGIVAHESLHLTNFVLHRAGVSLSVESEESYTYLLEETVEKILREIY